MSNAITVITKKIDASVQMVISAQALQGFERANLVATAIGELKEALNREYMRPIMALQGNKLGFKTDKDKEGGYSEEIVKNCLIEAVLSGFQPYGNQFNIIVGNMYGTREGFKELLDKWQGLKWEITPGLPHVSSDKTSAVVPMTPKWSLNGSKEEAREWTIAVKFGSYGTPDAAIGKAERKSRKRLYEIISGQDVPDGDINDMPNTESSEITMWKELAKEIKTLADLDAMEKENKEQIAANPKIKVVFDARRNELSKATPGDKAKQATQQAEGMFKK